jgi:DNA-binding NarL/FixJ family response regulator
MSIRAAIVSEESGLRDELLRVVNGSRRFSTAGMCDSVDEALTRFPSACPDVILLNLVTRPRLCELERIRQLKVVLPAAQIILFVGVEQLGTVFTAIRFGVTGFLLKSALGKRLLGAIQETHLGGSYICPEVAHLILAALQNPPPVLQEVAKLSERELQVVDLIAQGHEPKEIARELHITYETVKCHCRAVFHKLGVHTKRQAIAKLFPGKDFQAVVRRLSDGDVA